MPKQQRGLTLADILNSRKTISIDLEAIGFEGVEPMEVTFRTNFWTPEVRQRYLDSKTDVDTSNIEVLKAALIAWNCTDDGEALPINEENLRKLSSAILDTMVQEMLKAVRPNPENS